MHTKSSKCSRLLICLAFSITTYLSNAQDFMMQGWYWDYPKTIDGFTWADTMHQKAAELGTAGFTYMWLPPLSRASFGSGSNGYDPKDLYDLGIASEGPTGFGTRAQLDAVITAFSNNGIETIADVVYNHRDGGSPEENPSVEGWIENFDCTKVNAGDQPYPSDRFRCYLPLGGSSGNGAGSYYFKIRSSSGHPNFYGKDYKLYMQTNTVGYQGTPDLQEDENNSGSGNGGGDCGQGFNVYQLGKDMLAEVDFNANCGVNCGVDEFELTLTSSDFDAAGDTLWIFLNNGNEGYSDHFISGLWNGSMDIQSQIQYQTYTDYTNLPSGRGGMDYTYFKPNGNPTQLEGDWDAMLFFYDYDQRYEQKTKDSLNVWSKWLWEDVGIRGFRMDAVKHFNDEFVGDLMDYLHSNGIDPGMVVGEFFDFNAATLSNWVSNVESNMDQATLDAIDIRAFDFSLRSALKEACDNGGYDVRNIFSNGMVNGANENSYSVVTFVNNHDFREGYDPPVQNDPMLAYAYILTNNQIGLPCIFYPDYYQVDIPNAPSVYLKPEIDELMEIHQDYIFQSGSVDYLNQNGSGYSGNYISGEAGNTLLYQLSGGIGGKEIVVAINFSYNSLQLDHTINTTNLSQGDTLIDLLGNSNFPYALINGSSQIYVELPPRSYSVWASSPAESPLPVDLISFEALAQRDQVQLNWESANEDRLKGYEVQRSIDGIIYEPIAWVDTRGDGGYSTIDPAPYFNQPIYYRLKLEDQDGQFEYSIIRTVELQKFLSNISLLPNPTKGNSMLNFDASGQEEIFIELVDLNGKIISNRVEITQQGLNQITINSSKLVPGIYLVKIQVGSELEIKKLVKI